jgi:hypothetical protein
VLTALNALNRYLDEAAEWGWQQGPTPDAKQRRLALVGEQIKYRRIMKASSCPSVELQGDCKAQPSPANC